MTLQNVFAKSTSNDSVSRTLQSSVKTNGSWKKLPGLNSVRRREHRTDKSQLFQILIFMTCHIICHLAPCVCHVAIAFFQVTNRSCSMTYLRVKSSRRHHSVHLPLRLSVFRSTVVAPYLHGASSVATNACSEMINIPRIKQQTQISLSCVIPGAKE